MKAQLRAVGENKGWFPWLKHGRKLIVQGKHISDLPQLSKASCGLVCVELADMGPFVEREIHAFFVLKSHHFSHRYLWLLAKNTYIS